MNWAVVPKADVQTIYCVAGGPSLKDFDMSRLCSRTVVAVNDTARHLPLPGIAFSADRNWAHRRMSWLTTEFKGDIYLSVGYKYAVEGIKNLVRSREDGLSTDPGTVHVASSGYGALNVAFLMGAKEIFLLGYDYMYWGKHWHGERGNSNTQRQMVDHWAKKYETCLPQLREAGVRVWNANPDSRVAAFPKISLAEI